MWLSDFGSGTKYMTLCSCYRLCIQQEWKHDFFKKNYFFMCKSVVKFEYVNFLDFSFFHILKRQMLLC